MRGRKQRTNEMGITRLTCPSKTALVGAEPDRVKLAAIGGGFDLRVSSSC